MSGAWKHKLPQLFISHRAIIAAADTMRSSHQVPAERNNIILHARNLKLDSSFHPVTVCLRSLTAQRRFSSPARPVVPAADDDDDDGSPHFHSFTSERHLIISLYLSFSEARSGARLSCRLHYLSLPHGRTRSVPTTMCTQEMSGQPIYMPFITPGCAALKKNKKHTHAVSE